MADPDPKPVADSDPTADPKPAPDPAPEGVKSDPDPQKNALYPRVQELSAKNKDLQAENDKLNEAERKRVEEEDKKRGDYEKVIEAKDLEITVLKPKADLYDEYNQARRETLKSELPEQFHKQIESIGSLTELEEFAKNLTDLSISKGVALPKGNPTGAPKGEPLKRISEMTADERRETHAQRIAQHQA